MDLDFYLENSNIKRLTFSIPAPLNQVVLVYTHTNEDVLKVTSKAARDYGVDLRYEPVSPPLDGKGADTPYDAMRRIKESGFKTVILSVTRISILEHIAREAERWGVNTDDYVWLVWESATELETLANTKTERGSEMDKLLRGMGSVRTLDGYDWRDDDSFLARWKSRDVDFVEKLNAINPIVGEGKNGKPKPGYFRAEPDYFQNYPPMPFSSYMYDTVIALGMGACRTQKIQRQLQVEAPTANDHDEEGSGGGAGALIDEIEVEEFGALRRLQVKQGKLYKPGPNLQYNETLKVTFDGASGFVKLDNGMIYTRDEETIGFGVYNLRPVDTPDETTYEYAITSKRIPGGQWAEVPGVSFVYADGSNIQPTPVREVFENNFLSPSVRAGGFALFSIAAFICIGLAAWTFAKRNSSIVRAAQPEFLYLLCFGSLASLMAIITLSFDESYGTSVETLSAMCTATPWLFCTGYMIVYMALFSKLYRINKVLQFRRRQVKAHHVVLPAVVLILLALIVLALWTALDPYVWVRETVDDESGETFGTCTSNNATAYIVTLSILVITATLLAFVMAYKTRDLPGKYTDAGPIFFGIVAQLEVWFVGIPILVIVDNVSADAMYLARVLIIWIFAVIMVLTVIGSKFLQTYGCWNAHSHQQSDGVHYSGGGTVHISGMTSSNELFCSKRGLTTGDSKGGENRTSGTTNPGGSASVLSAQQVSNPSLDIALSRGSSSVAPLNSSSNGSAPAAQVEPELTP